MPPVPNYQISVPTSKIEGRPPAWEYLLFALMVVMHLLPIWAFAYFPSQDGPIHLSMAQTLKDYHVPEYGAFREYYHVVWSPDRNVFLPILMLALMQVFTVLTAEKLVLTLIVVLLPLSALYAARAFRRDTLAPAFFIFPFVFSYPLFMGFYAFSLAMVPFFITTGYWLRHHGRLSWSRVPVLALLGLLTYFCHIFAALNLVLVIAAGTLWAILHRWSRSEGQFRRLRGLLSASIRDGLKPFLALLPAIVLILKFLEKNGASAPKEFALVERLFHLVAFTPIWSLSRWDMYFTVPLNATLIFLFILALGMKGEPPSLRRHGLLAVFLFYLAFFFLAPGESSGSVFIVNRLLPYVFFVLILWLVVQPFRPKVIRAAGAVAAVAAIALVCWRLPQMAELNDLMGEYLSGMEQVEPNSTLLSLHVAVPLKTSDGKPVIERTQPFLHAAGHIAVQRQVVDLKNFQAAHGHFFPLEYRSDLNPFLHISKGIESIPPSDLAVDYPPGSKGRVDYVLIWGLGREEPEEGAVLDLLRRLEKDFRLVFISPQRGLMRLYRNNAS